LAKIAEIYPVVNRGTEHAVKLVIAIVHRFFDFLRFVRGAVVQDRLPLSSEW